MKNFKKSIYKIEFLFLFLIIILFFVNDQNDKYLISFLGTGIIFFITFMLYKRKRDDSFYKVYATEILMIVILIFVILLAGLGLIIGFSKTLFSLNYNTWLKGLIPTLVLTVITEYFRFILIKNNMNEKLGIYAITVLMMLFTIITFYGLPDFTNSYKIFVFICTIVFPVIAKELLTTHMIYNYGLRPALVYKLIMNLYIYITPIMTDLGDYLYSAIGVIIPFTIYIVLKKLVSIEDKKNKRFETKTLNWTVIPFLIVLLILVILVSGITKYHMIAIASGSMVPTFCRGDAIIYEKIEKTEIRLNDVIVFKKDGKIISHRVIKITENNEKLYFYTKGDANYTNDPGATIEDDVMGRVIYIVKYIGYPTVWVNERLRR